MAADALGNAPERRADADARSARRLREASTPNQRGHTLRALTRSTLAANCWAMGQGQRRLARRRTPGLGGPMKEECGRPCVLATVGALWILLNAANAASPLNPASNPVYITHVTVIDTRTGKEARDRTVVISGDRIQAVTDSKGVKPPTGAKSVDATGKYVIPGLWDMHAHMLDRWELLGLLYLANGVTGVRDMGTTKPLEEITRVKKEAMNGTVLVPRFVAAGPLLDGWVRWPGYTLVVSSAEEARRAVASLQAEGADFIKVYNSLSREAFFAIAGETKKRGMVFAGHVPYSVSAEEAPFA